MSEAPHLRRLMQIVKTAHRVRPSDVGGILIRMNLTSPQFKRGLQRSLAATTVSMATAAGAIPAMTYDAPWLGGHPSPAQITRTQQERAALPSNIPTWNKRLSRQFEGYVDTYQQPVGRSRGAVPQSHVVVRQDASRAVMSPAEVSRRLESFGGTRSRGDDVWVVGNRWPRGTNLSTPNKPHPQLQVDIP